MYPKIRHVDTCTGTDAQEYNATTEYKDPSRKHMYGIINNHSKQQTTCIVLANVAIPATSSKQLNDDPQSIFSNSI